VTHAELATRVDLYVDGELAPDEARDLEAHFAACPTCAQARDARLRLRAALRREAAPLRAPAALRDRVRRAARTADSTESAWHRAVFLAWRALPIAASLGVVAAGSWWLGAGRAATNALADAVLASHIRSLMPGHLTDVASSDQHTVKPWFNGRVDFSPPVADFAGQGYPLLGGRLDYVAGRPVAALVYGRRQHFINVFVWPSSRGSGGPATASRQGYHLLRWTTPDYAYWVVSDLALPELQTFADMLRRSEATVAPTR
jgi:anti-sigma factor (TIGR02949 family)